MWPHATAEMHIEPLAARSAEVSHAFQVRVRDDPAAPRRGSKPYQQHIVSAFRMQLSPPLPVRNDVELAAQIERPGIEKAG